MKKKLLVVCGGQSSEHSISRISCNSVMKHLDKDKYEITLVGIAKDGKWYILKQEDNDLSKDTWLDGAEVVEGVFNLLRSQDVAFPVLHGLYGEDGTIQGLFELAQLPYVGCRVFASSACMDKIFAKKVFESAGIPQVKSVYVKKRNDGRLVVVEKDMEETEEVEASIMKELGMPCFIKASRSGSSVGCYRCDKVEDLLREPMKDFLTKACSKMQGVQYMENKSYQLRYLPIFETDLLSTVNYITNVLKNDDAALRLVDDIESAILKRLENPLAFEPYRSAKRREYPYYRIYVRNYVVYYVVIGNVMEVRRLIYKST